MSLQIRQGFSIFIKIFPLKKRDCSSYLNLSGSFKNWFHQFTENYNQKTDQNCGFTVWPVWKWRTFDVCTPFDPDGLWGDVSLECTRFSTSLTLDAFTDVFEGLVKIPNHFCVLKAFLKKPKAVLFRKTITVTTLAGL